jgi:hypothetical protein
LAPALSPALPMMTHPAIATYSVAGDHLGTKLLWTVLLTWPLMAAVQMMCARIGEVTGQGLAANIKKTKIQGCVPEHAHAAVMSSSRMTGFPISPVTTNPHISILP